MGKACGNSDCAVSTGIHEGLTFGSGNLDSHGYWEKPCHACARANDASQPKQRANHEAELISLGKSPEFATAATKSAEWLWLESWPFASMAEAAL